MWKRTGGYSGSSDVLTSTANQQLVVGGKLYSEFYFYNTQACHVKVNGSGAIYLMAGQNFEIDETNPMINSFIIVDSGVSLSWVGIYE